MGRYFNTTGACNPQRHYMVNIEERLKEIKKLVDAGEYFTINRARQYGKTTTLKALAEYLKAAYIVISLDFQMLGNADFADENTFSLAFSDYLLRTIGNRRNLVVGLNEDVLRELDSSVKKNSSFPLRKLFACLSDLCDTAEKPIVLIIDEVDSATNNQVFLDFLAQLRGYFLTRDETPTFQSVILAGVYDVKNIKRKISPWNTHAGNEENVSLRTFDDCPWDYREPVPYNIAADFDVVMSLSENGIAGMLKEYETDHHTGMDVAGLAVLIYEYTSGYPFLVSRICKLLDEKVAGNERYADESAAWTKDGFLEAVKLLLSEKNTLFESLMGKLYEYPGMRQMMYSILFSGEKVLYNPDEQWVDIAMMFGFVKNSNGTVIIANRIFEMRLYNYFLATTDAQNSEMFKLASQDKSQFIRGGFLDMKLILAKFVEHFDSIYGDSAEEFDEEEGRRRFLLYLRPIINGTGNYYIEAETRNARRMDVVVDYHGEQFIIELKVWRGNAYNERGEQQLSDCLDYFRLKKGYMLSYNFNKKKEIGVKEIHIGDRVLVEAVV